MVIRKDGFCVIMLCQSIDTATSCALDITQAATDRHNYTHTYHTQTPTDTTNGQLVYTLNGNVASNCQHDRIKRE